MSQAASPDVINVTQESNADLLERFLTEFAHTMHDGQVSTEDKKPDPRIPPTLKEYAGFDAWPTDTLEARWNELRSRAHHQDIIMAGGDDRI